MKVEDAISSRNTLIREIYSELCGWILTKINTDIKIESSVNSIGILDIFGFGKELVSDGCPNLFSGTKS